MFVEDRSKFASHFFDRLYVCRHLSLLHPLRLLANCDRRRKSRGQVWRRPLLLLRRRRQQQQQQQQSARHRHLRHCVKRGLTLVLARGHFPRANPSRAAC